MTPARRLADPDGWLARHVWLLFAASALVMGTIAVFDRHLRTDAAPLGILSIELAWSASAARAMLASWSAVIDDARLVQLLDMVFPVAYGSFLAAVAARNATMGPAAAELAARGAVLAAALDYVENGPILAALYGVGPTDAGCLVTASAAVLKFGILFGVFGALGLLGIRRARGAR